MTWEWVGGAAISAVAWQVESLCSSAHRSMASPSEDSKHTTEEDLRVLYHPKLSLDDITSSTADEIPKANSFIYNPNSASSENTSITSYKTEKTVNSRKSRYNTLPRRKYADIGQPRLPPGLVSEDVEGASTPVSNVRRTIGHLATTTLASLF